jgi:glycosyltransferase involved in cell wall biosynthesis
MDEIPVIVPVMNEEEKIGQCLEAVFDQLPVPIHEVRKNQ